MAARNQGCVDGADDWRDRCQPRASRSCCGATRMPATSSPACESPHSTDRDARGPAAIPPIVGAVDTALIARRHQLFERLAGRHLQSPHLGNRAAGRPRERRDRCRPTGISVVLWGNSHAGHFVAGLRERVGEGRFARYGNNAGCPPLLEITTVASHPANPGRLATGSLRAGEECRKLNDETLRAILARPEHPHGDAGGGPGNLLRRNRPFHGGRPLRARRPRCAAQRRKLAPGISNRTDSHGASPPRARHPRSAVRRHAARSDLDHQMSDPCAHARPQSGRLRHGQRPRPAASRLLESLVDELGNLPGVVAFKPSDHLCRDRRCPVRVGLAPIYLDADHLTLAGADYVLRKLDSQSPGVFGGTDHLPKP